MAFALAKLLQDRVDGLFIIDGRQRIVHWDPACEKLFGLSARSVVGRVCHQILNQLTLGGEERCNAHCSLGEISCGQMMPHSLSLSMRTAGSMRPELRMHTMLVPSQDESGWNVVHVLSRGKSLHSAVFEADAGPDGEHTEPRKEPCSRSPLTRREMEILRLLAAGHSTARMAEILCVSQVTVRNHIQHLLNKMGVHSRLEAVACAKQHGVAL